MTVTQPSGGDTVIAAGDRPEERPVASADLAALEQRLEQRLNSGPTAETAGRCSSSSSLPLPCWPPSSPSDSDLGPLTSRSETSRLTADARACGGHGRAQPR